MTDQEALKYMISLGDRMLNGVYKASHDLTDDELSESLGVFINDIRNETNEDTMTTAVSGLVGILAKELLRLRAQKADALEAKAN